MKKIISIFMLLTLVLSCAEDNTLKFKRSDYGEKWPFSVDKIEIYCAGYKEIYCEASDGKIYPLNGSAKSASINNPKISKIEEIWLDNPEFPGTKIPYSDFIGKGLQLCEDK